MSHVWIVFSISSFDSERGVLFPLLLQLVRLIYEIIYDVHVFLLIYHKHFILKLLFASNLSFILQLTHNSIHCHVESLVVFDDREQST